MKNQFIYFTLVSLALYGCSSSTNIEIDEEHKANIEININQIYSWVNMMPGPNANPRFQVTGDIEIPQSEDFELSSIRLKLVRVHQNNKPYFVIKPTILENKKNTTKKNKQFIFSTISGLKLVQGFNADEKIDIELIFDDDGTSFTHKIFDVSVEKAF